MTRQTEGSGYTGNLCDPSEGADPGFLKGGSILGLQAKKGGPTLGPVLKSLHRGPKGGGSGPPERPGSAHASV